MVISMKKWSVTALGGCEEVGRSSFLLDVGAKILLDRGIKLTPEKTEYPADVKTNLDAVIISHAHLDHSGLLPHLFSNARPLTYMTKPTLELAEILWHDSLKIAGLEGIDAKFTKTEVENTMRYVFPIRYNKELEIAGNVTMEFYDAGHILGSAITRLEMGNKVFIYTGDFKMTETRLLHRADLPKVKADYVMIESTYGDRDHPNRIDTENEFVETVQSIVDKGGTALIPAFAVGRSQEIIDVLYEHKVDFPVYLDGMGQKAARITLRYPEYLKDARFLKRALESVEWIRSDRQRKKALSEPSAIVTTAGMLEGGPALHYIKKIYNDPNSGVLLTGYQVEGTTGELLLRTGRIEIDGREYEVKGLVKKFDFSAHASQSSMLKALKYWSPEKVLLVHGDSSTIKVFKEKIGEELGMDAEILKMNRPVILD
jgi:putative mRNA 3-end processing factor